MKADWQMAKSVLAAVHPMLMLLVFSIGYPALEGWRAGVGHPALAGWWAVVGPPCLHTGELVSGTTVGG